MKKIILFSHLFFLICETMDAQFSIDTFYLKARSTRIIIHAGDETGGWNAQPGVSLSSQIPLRKDKLSFAFVSDIDSLKVDVVSGIPFLIRVIYDGKDSSSFEIHPYLLLESAVYTKKYINKNNGRINIEIPEMHELVNIVMALTEVGKSNNALIEKNTSYYREVIKHFSRFSNYPVIIIFDSLIKRDINNYHSLKMNSYIYEYKKRLRHKKIYNRIFGRQNGLEPYIKMLVDFSRASDFLKFYRKHKLYYSYLTSEEAEKVKLRQMWGWLEARFPEKYNSYKIVFSSLVSGFNATQRFDNNNFKEMIMFISAPDSQAAWLKSIPESKTGIEGELSKVIFTEIDHNYINPESNKYSSLIEEEFKKRDKWLSDPLTLSYNSPMMAFNEYMTWAVFSLYIYDNYNKPDFESIHDRMINFMVKERGFIRFKEFDEKLLQMYKNKGAVTSIHDLYPSMLEWCRK